MWGLPWWSSGKTLCFHARDLGLIPCWGIKIPHTAWRGQKVKKKKKKLLNLCEPQSPLCQVWSVIAPLSRAEVRIE